MRLLTAYVCVRGVCIALPWIVQLFVADLGLSALLPVSAFFPTFVYDVSSRIAASVWYAVQFIFTRVNHAEITVSGSKLPPGESAIIVANHVAWTDFYMIQELAVGAGMLGRCRWFAKEQLKWVPFLGWGLWAMGMPLVSRKWLQDRAAMDRVFGSIVRERRPIWLISYSEGTRYTVKKHADTVEWCKAHGRAAPRHTLFPRTKGFVAMVSQLRQAPQVKAVYDCTIAYARGNQFMKPPSLWETLSSPFLGQEYSFHVHVERYPFEDLPGDDAEVARWLEERWAAKGALLEELEENVSRTGSFRTS